MPKKIDFCRDARIMNKAGFLSRITGRALTSAAAVSLLAAMSLIATPIRQVAAQPACYTPSAALSPTVTAVLVDLTILDDPIYDEPAPVVVEPTPVVVEPTPVVAEPTPVVAEPTPVVEEPQPDPPCWFCWQDTGGGGNSGAE